MTKYVPDGAQRHRTTYLAKRYKEEGRREGKERRVERERVGRESRKEGGREKERRGEGGRKEKGGKIEGREG